MCAFLGKIIIKDISLHYGNIPEYLSTKGDFCYAKRTVINISFLLPDLYIFFLHFLLRLFGSFFFCVFHFLLSLLRPFISLEFTFLFHPSFRPSPYKFSHLINVFCRGNREFPWKYYYILKFKDYFGGLDVGGKLLKRSYAETCRRRFCASVVYVYSTACNIVFVRFVKVNLMDIRRKCLDNLAPMSSSCW